MLLALAWRNIWRNRRRTLITVSALTLGVVAVTAIHTYRESAFGAMIAEVTAGLLGHLQVHGKGYQAEPEIGNVVPDPQLVEARLAQALPGARPVRRVLGYGLAGAGEASSAALVLGVQPDRERAGGRPLLAIEQGRDLGDAPAHEAVIGRDLARQLEVSPGAELVLVGQAADGSVANDVYTVAGVADAGSSELNGSAVFLEISDAQAFFGLGDGVHQVIVRLPGADNEDLARPLALLRGSLDLATLEVLSWSQILPELRGTMEAKRRGQHVIDLVVILIVGLGVLNTMTMSTFERTRELGVLASLGTRRRRILGLIVAEALLQGALGCLAGVAIAVGAVWAIGSIPLGSLSSQDIMGVRFPPVIELHIQWVAVRTAAFTALATVLAGGLWPAIRAARLKPVEATRYV